MKEDCAFAVAVNSLLLALPVQEGLLEHPSYIGSIDPIEFEVAQNRPPVKNA